MRDEEVSAADVLLEVQAAVEPFLARAGEALPKMPRPADLHALVILQLQPLVARLVLSGPSTALEAFRLVGPEVPGHVELAEALERFVAAGLSGLPAEVAAGALRHASSPGAGLLVTLDLETGELACFLAPSRIPLSRALRLFGVEVPESSSCASAVELSARTYTAH